MGGAGGNGFSCFFLLYWCNLMSRACRQWEIVWPALASFVVAGRLSFLPGGLDGRAKGRAIIIYPLPAYSASTIYDQMLYNVIATMLSIPSFLFTAPPT